MTRYSLTFTKVKIVGMRHNNWKYSCCLHCTYLMVLFLYLGYYKRDKKNQFLKASSFASQHFTLSGPAVNELLGTYEHINHLHGNSLQFHSTGVWLPCMTMKKRKDLKKKKLKRDENPSKFRPKFSNSHSCSGRGISISSAPRTFGICSQFRSWIFQKTQHALHVGLCKGN